MLGDNQHPEYFLPEAIGGYCSITCCMGIMNYFWGTSFNGQNTRQLMNLFKEGRYSGEEMLDLPEIACKLDQLGFNVSYYLSYDKSFHIDYVNNPENYVYEWYPEKYHKFIKKGENGYYWDAGTAICSLDDTSFERKIFETESIISQYNMDIVETIKKQQDDDALFLVGLDYYILHSEEPVEGMPGGHVVLVSKIEGDNVIVFDPGPPLKQYRKVAIDRFMESVEDFGKKYSFIKIMNKHE